MGMSMDQSAAPISVACSMILTYSRSCGAGEHEHHDLGK